VWRRREGGSVAQDWLTEADEPPPTDPQPLLVPVMHHGRRLREGTPALAGAREQAKQERAALPPACRVLDAEERVPVRVGQRLTHLLQQVAAQAGRP
jgi:hypothetical protein